MVKLIGGLQMVKLFDHVGVVLEDDSYDEAIKKIEIGIKSQTNQATARFKLFREMAQGGKAFADWWPKVKEQADRCDWANYDVKQACRDALQSRRIDWKPFPSEISHISHIFIGNIFF